jgi:hypothetical protein
MNIQMRRRAGTDVTRAHHNEIRVSIADKSIAARQRDVASMTIRAHAVT